MNNILDYSRLFIKATISKEDSLMPNFLFRS